LKTIFLQQWWAVENFETFFSNRLDLLYQNLKQNLFDSTVPFKRRLIVVYGPAMKSWLMLQMAADLQVAAGIEIIYLQEAFERLTQLFQIEPQRFLPSSIEIACASEQAILKILNAFPDLDEKGRQAWMPILQYLKLEDTGGPLTLSRKAEKRLIGLSQQIATCFQEYGKYAPQLIQKWKEKPPLDNWQARLWLHLFSEASPWSYLCQKFQQPLVAPENIELHFFSISFIAPAEFQFLYRLSQYVPVQYYLLSPCAMFWTDIRSDKESAYLQSHWQRKMGKLHPQVVSLEEFLRDRNPLLANFGRLGREMVYQVEESAALTYATYCLPQHALQPEDESIDDLHALPTHVPLTLLHALQADILLMRNPQNKPQTPIEAADRSIQLHMAPTKRREVEVLYQQILGLIDRNPDLLPHDIIVMAPQIVEYMPYIQSIFGASDSELDFQILDLGMQAQSNLTQGFLQLLALSDSRWDAAQCLQLFEHKSFQKRHGLTASDYALIQQWIENSRIRWGETGEHRNEILQRFHCPENSVDDTEIGTWEYGIGRLLMGLAAVVQDNVDLDVIPCDQMEFSQSELLGKWIRVLHSLRDDLAPLHDQSHLTIDEWVNYLHCLLENYFEPEDDQSSEDYEELKNQFETLRIATRTLKVEKFSFISIKAHLDSLLEHRGVTYRENQLQSIRFCSMLPLRAIPTKAIAILGMQEGAFPRHHPQSALNVAQGDCDHCPNVTDYDRYLFLEILHAAQDYLIISYQGYNQRDGKELQPSLIIEELFSYLDKHYTVGNDLVSKACIFYHPFDAFNKIYFQNNTPLISFSVRDYRLAKACLAEGKKPPHAFLNSFERIEHPQNEVIPNGSTIDIKHLAAVARNPIKFHLNKVLEIYLQTEEERQVKSDEDFTISALDKYILKKSSLKEPVEKVLFRAEKEGKLPHGLFKTVASTKITEEIDELHARLKKHQLSGEDVFQIEFCTSCLSPVQTDSNSWIFPAPALTYADGYRIHITGKLDNVTHRGLISMSRGTLAEAWKVWPNFLLYNCAANQHPTLLEKQLILAFNSKPKKAFFDDSEPYLKQFVNYYSLCLKNFSPLIPEWLPLILEGNKKGLQDKMQQLFSNFGSEYQSADLRWILNKDRLPCTEKMVAYWQEQAHSMLGDLQRHWFVSKEAE
jgi:exodeoxyribonuclease V gamma subunit